MTAKFTDPLHERIFESARPYLQTRRNELHTLLSFRYAKKLLKAEGGDPDVAIPGILLHDVGWSAVPEHLLEVAYGPRMKDTALRDVHEREGAKIALRILADAGFSKKAASRISLYVSRHDSGMEVESLEEAIIKDSDKLYRFTPEAVSYDPGFFRMEASDYLSHIGKRIDSWFFTATGKRIARGLLGARKREIRLAGSAKGPGETFNGQAI